MAVVDQNQYFQNVEAIYVGGSPSDSKATLCIYADEIDLEALTKVIGCEPTKARRKGEKDEKRPKIAPAPVGQWFLEAPDNLSFEDKIKFLLQSTEADFQIWQEVHKIHRIQLRCVIFLESWTEGFSFSPETLLEIGKRKWEFSLSMYSADGDEIVDAFLNKGGD